MPCWLQVQRGTADDVGMTPLLYTTEGGHEVVVNALLAAGAEVDKASTDGSTPLKCAAKRGHEVVVKALHAHMEQKEIK